MRMPDVHHESVWWTAQVVQPRLHRALQPVMVDLVRRLDEDPSNDRHRGTVQRSCLRCRLASAVPARGHA